MIIGIFHNEMKNARHLEDMVSEKGAGHVDSSKHHIVKGGVVIYGNVAYNERPRQRGISNVRLPLGLNSHSNVPKLRQRAFQTIVAFPFGAKRVFRKTFGLEGKFVVGFNWLLLVSTIWAFQIMHDNFVHVYVCAALAK